MPDPGNPNSRWRTLGRHHAAEASEPRCCAAGTSTLILINILHLQRLARMGYSNISSIASIQQAIVTVHTAP